MNEILKAQNLCKSFGKIPIIKNINFYVDESEIMRTYDAY